MTFEGEEGVHQRRKSKTHTNRALALQQSVNELQMNIQQSLAALASLEARWLRLVHTAAETILVLDREGTILLVSCLPDGLERNHIIGASVYDYVSAQSCVLLHSLIEAVVSDGACSEHEVLGEGAGGKPAWYKTRVGAYCENGHVKGVILIATDVTRSKEIEAELKRQQQYTAHVVANAPTIICAVAPDGTTNSVNRAITEVTGYQPEEIIGNNWWEIFYPGEYYTEVERLMREFAKSESVINYDMVLVAKDGSEKTISWSSVNRQREDGSLLEIIGIGADITERKKAQQQVQAQERVLRKLLELQERECSSFTEQVHEDVLQQLIAAQLLIDGLVDRSELTGTAGEDLRRALCRLNKAVAAGRQVIKNLRPMAIDDLGITDAVAFLIEELSFASQLQVTYTHRVRCQRLEPMLATTIFRILQQLLDNVIQHSQTSAASVHLAESDQRLILTVSDHGCGFEPSAVPIEKFGLCAVRERAHVFGGHAVICSAPGEGTVVTVTLPLAPAGTDPS